MNLKKISPAALTLFVLAAYGGKTKTSAPTDGMQQSTPSVSTPAAVTSLVGGQNYTVLPVLIPQNQAGKIEVLEFFGYFCPHCQYLGPVLTEHVKTFKDDTYLRGEHVVWNAEMKPPACSAAVVDIAGERAKADSLIPNAYINQKINLADANTVEKWLNGQIVFDGKKVSAAHESPESQARADQMEKLTNTYQTTSTPAVIAGGKYTVKFVDWQSGIQAVGLLIDKVREEQKTQPAK